MEIDKITVWSAQAEIVINTINQTGIYHVNKDFILKKYADISKLFLEPYDWFISRVNKIIPPPVGAEYPIWVYSSLENVANYGTGDLIIEAQIPMDKIILFDQEKWLRILNFSYIPQDLEDDKSFKKTLSDYGMQHGSQAYTSNFYPDLKREIVKSWDRLFDESIRLSNNNMGALWEIKKDWIINIK